MNDLSPPPSQRPWPVARPASGITALDLQRIVEWIGDAFAILCVRLSSGSPAETSLRLGFEAILRQLGTSPLKIVASSKPLPFSAATASAADLRQILKALDSCLAIFQRYDAVLNAAQRRIQILARATKRFAEEELSARLGRSTARELATNAA